MASKNTVLTVNEIPKALLLHDTPLGFEPSWVEFSRDDRGVRIVSTEGVEFRTGVLINIIAWQQLDGVHDVLIVLVRDQVPVEGYEVPFINQDYNGTGA